MLKIKIQISKLVGDDAIRFSCSGKQITFIQSLMDKKNMSGIFNKYFTFKGKPICNHLTIKEASKLISSLLKPNVEITFKEYEPTEILKEKKLVNPISQPKTFNSDVPKISFAEQQAKLNSLE